MKTSTVAADHPGWQLVATGWRRVLADEQGNPFVMHADMHGSIRCQPLGEQSVGAPSWRVAHWPRGLAGDVPPLAEVLSSLGHVVRVANPSLWDARHSDRQASGESTASHRPLPIFLGCIRPTGRRRR